MLYLPRHTTFNLVEVLDVEMNEISMRMRGGTAMLCSRPRETVKSADRGWRKTMMCVNCHVTMNEKSIAKLKGRGNTCEVTRIGSNEVLLQCRYSLRQLHRSIILHDTEDKAVFKFYLCICSLRY